MITNESGKFTLSDDGKWFIRWAAFPHTKIAFGAEGGLLTGKIAGGMSMEALDKNADDILKKFEHSESAKEIAFELHENGELIMLDNPRDQTWFKFNGMK